MNDLEHDLRELLDGKARGAGLPSDPEPRLLRRARRRQLGTVVSGVVVVAALVAASVAGVRALVSPNHTTIGDQPVVTRTVNGISIDVPESWHVADPADVDLAAPDTGLPRLVLILATIQPGPMVSCPGIATGPTSSLLLTIQQLPLTLSGGASTPWPVTLEQFLETTGSGCYPSWEFLHATWTAAGRSFEAVAGFAPEASSQERGALMSAFSSLRFEPSEGSPEAWTIATGEVGGQAWTITLGGDPDARDLSFGWDQMGGGGGGISAPRADGFGGGISGGSNETHPSGDTGAEPLPYERTGVVTAEAERVEYQLEDGTTIEAELYPLPAETFDAPAKVFLLFVPTDVLVEAGYLVAYDAAGEQVGRTYMDFSPVWLTSKIIEEATPEQLDVLHDLQIAGGVMQRYFNEHDSSLAGLDPATAAAISDAVTYNTSAVAVPGEVSLRISGPSDMVLASATADGQVYSACFVEGSLSMYGRNDTSDPNACSNDGWP